MTQLLLGAGQAVPITPAFLVDADTFDGTNDYMSRGAGLTGAADSTTGILSMWIRINAGNGTNRTLFDSTGSRVRVRMDTANNASVQVTNSAGSSVFTLADLTARTSGATWLHILASWDTNFSAGNKLGNIYINDIANQLKLDSAAAFTVDYTLADWFVGANNLAATKFNGDMAEIYFAPGQYLDFATESNRRKFITAGGKPVDLGSDGSTPTGSQPIMYHSLRPGDAATDFATNRGSGGNFTITGALAIAATSPSD